MSRSFNSRQPDAIVAFSTVRSESALKGARLASVMAAAWVRRGYLEKLQAGAPPPLTESAIIPTSK